MQRMQDPVMAGNYKVTGDTRVVLIVGYEGANFYRCWGTGYPQGSYDKSKWTFVVIVCYIRSETFSVKKVLNPDKEKRHKS